MIMRIKQWGRILSTSVILIVSPLPFSVPSSSALDSSSANNPIPTPGGGKNEAESFSTRYLAARKLYFTGAAGNTEDAAQAREAFQELSHQDPDNPLVIAYLGSSRVLEAKEAFLPWKKKELAREGLKLLEQAVALAPGNLEILFLRGVSSYPLPLFFGVRDQAEVDFAFAAARLKEAPSAAPPEIAAGVFYYHGLCLADGDQKDQAIRFWKKAITLAPVSSFARRAREKLEELE